MAKFLIYTLIALCLTACATTAATNDTQLTQYRHSINYHFNRNAYLFWQTGTIQATAATNKNGDEQVNNPPSSTYAYGKEEQAIFMTSLQNALEDQRAFTHVQLLRNPQRIPLTDVMITVNFKNTQVLGETANFRVILDVELTIKTIKGEYTRYYRVRSDAGNMFNTPTYLSQQQDASQRLMNMIINGIGDWQDVATPATPATQQPQA